MANLKFPRKRVDERKIFPFIWPRCFPSIESCHFFFVCRVRTCSCTPAKGARTGSARQIRAATREEQKLSRTSEWSTVLSDVFSFLLLSRERLRDYWPTSAARGTLISVKCSNMSKIHGSRYFSSIQNRFSNRILFLSMLPSRHLRQY